jgi:alanine-glyoxylate transaminase/serine-glyoxylate transaminase/serine-pyruvate transaminase
VLSAFARRSASGIEVGGGLGPSAPPIWRIGVMGPNANAATVDRVLAALAGAVESRRAVVAG